MLWDRVNQSSGVCVDQRWYIVHTYSGFENKVKKNLEERIKTLGKEEFFGRIIVPTEQVMELRGGQKKTSSRKFFPGYILVRMILNEETWHIVRNTAKVTGFIGGEVKPTPIPDKEAESKMMGTVLDLLKDEEKQAVFAEKIKSLAIIDSGSRIADEIISLMN